MRTSAGQEKPVDIMLAGIAALDASIDKTSRLFRYELPKINNKGDRADLKKALDSCIEMLKDLSSQI